VQDFGTKSEALTSEIGVANVVNGTARCRQQLGPKRKGVSMNHVALVGDSVFDNLVYVQPEPDVQQQLRDILPEEWKVTLGAIDGNVTDDVSKQLKELPEGVSHVVVSVGGNDGLQSMGILTEQVSSVAEGLGLLSGVVAEFQANYSRMLEDLVATKIPATVCTIYRPQFEPALQRVTLMALSLFNDVILTEAMRMRLPVLDLRPILDEASDYANEIEPSAKGGEKMAMAISHILLSNEANIIGSWVYRRQ
jgi:lysophospholipase L1-like esterase